VTTLNGIYQFLVTPFSRFRLQPSGNTGGQHDTILLSCHDANRRELKESRSRNTNSLPTHDLI